MSFHTPWEQHEGIWFKREDKFAPLGYGGPNGSKLRQLIHLFHRHRGNATHVVTGASVLSPQHLMTAIVAYHYGLPSRHVIASQHPERHLSTRIAQRFGAHFESIKVGYNPAIQRKVRELLLPDSFLVPYGISIDHENSRPEDLLAFHQVGANQVQNIPADVTTLVAPAGSCNSLTSIMLGLYQMKDRHHVRKLISIGIGPDRREFTTSRLRRMGVDLNNLGFEWDNSHSLHDSGYAGYSDAMPESFGGINFHPTYEGKMIRWMKEHGWLVPNVGLGFWIVGSDVDEAVSCACLDT